ncbi:MAG TPA: 5'-nucleotidase C-terminal domain-containing protein [Pelobium sp.]|nr:5'-nucleotidase C-terminal domain-containing protein [Pelobium sp.]
MQKSILNLWLTGTLFLVACSSQRHVSKTEKQLYPITSAITPDSSMEAFVFPYRQKLDSVMNDVVAVSAKEIQKGKPEGLLNNFFADAMYQSGKDWGLNFDFAYTNFGGLRTPLPKGEIYRYKVFELMPFENAVTLVTFKGDDLQAFFDFMAASGGEPISGATYVIDGDKAIEISINGKPFDRLKNYVVLTSDYMANGGDGGLIFTRAIARTDLTYKLRDALFLYLDKKKKAGEILNPVKDGRVKIK